MSSGRVVKVLIDKSRKEVFSQDEQGRQIVISIFYPIKGNSNSMKQLRYADLFSPYPSIFLEKFTKMGANENYLKELPIKVYNEAPIIENDKSYPVIIYSPGFGVNRDNFMFCIEELVEAGYIVVTLGHGIDANFTIYPDGRILNRPKQVEELDDMDFEEWHQLIDIREKDVSFLIDLLQQINGDDELISGKLDLERIGVVGHSIGGASSLKAAMLDQRIKACVVLDGSLYLNKISNYSKRDINKVPVLLFRMDTSDYKSMKDRFINIFKNSYQELTQLEQDAEKLAGTFVESQIKLYDVLSTYKSFVRLKGSDHMTFTDYPILFNEEKTSYGLSIQRAHEIISTSISKFFEEFLWDTPKAYRDFITCNEYPEIFEIDGSGKIQISKT